MPDLPEITDEQFDAVARLASMFTKSASDSMRENGGRDDAWSDQFRYLTGGVKEAVTALFGKSVTYRLEIEVHKRTGIHVYPSAIRMGNDNKPAAKG